MTARRLLLRTRAALAAAALLLAPALATGQTFDFDAAPFAGVPLALTAGGVTATFDSPLGGFAVLDFGPGVFAGLGGRVLGTVDADIFVEPLTITFDRVLASLSLAFAINDFLGGTELSLQAFLGATPVGAPVTASATTPPGFPFPEGALAVAGAFDRVELSSDAVDFFVDRIVVAPRVVPEPATLGLLGVGLAALAAGARGRASRRVMQSGR